MKILQVGRDIDGTGGGRVLVEVSKHLRNMQHEVVVLTDVLIPALGADGITVLTTPLGVRLHSWAPNLRVLRVSRHFLQLLLFSIFGTLKARKYSRSGWLVINHNVEILGGHIVVLHNVFSAEHKKDARLPRAKLKRWFNPVFALRIARERLMLARTADKVVCAVSAATAEEAREYVARGALLTSISNGVNTDLFTPLPPEQRLRGREANGTSDQFVLLFVGHEFERKGLAVLMEALTLLPVQVKLQVLGGRSGTQLHHEKLADELGVRDRVEFLGTRSNTREYYQLADVFVLPSSYEAWPLVGLESMACGTPALMTAVGGIPEFLRNGENGFLVERDARDIAAKVLMIMSDAALFDHMRTGARETALRYSWLSVSKQYSELAQRAL